MRQVPAMAAAESESGVRSARRPAAAAVARESTIRTPVVLGSSHSYLQLRQRMRANHDSRSLPRETAAARTPARGRATLAAAPALQLPLFPSSLLRQSLPCLPRKNAHHVHCPGSSLVRATMALRKRTQPRRRPPTRVRTLRRCRTMVRVRSQ